MKWTKRELQRLPKEGLEESLELSFASEDIPEYMGIRRIESCQVTYQLQFDAYAQHVVLKLRLHGRMIVPCSISFEDVDLAFNTHSTQVYALEESTLDEQDILPMDEVLDLKQECLSLIWLEVPARVISPNLRELPKGEGWEVVDEQSYQQRKSSTIDPRLEKLMAYVPEDEEEV